MLRPIAFALAALLAAVAPSAPPAAAAAVDTIEGVVVDKDGHPIEQAWIDVRDEDGLSPPGKNRAMTTRDDGKFAFTLLPPGRFRLRAVAKYCAWKRTEPIALGTSDVRVVLEGEKHLRGCVVDAELQPVSGAKVTLRIPEAAIAPAAATQDDGRFTLSHLTESAGELVVAATGRGAQRRAKHVLRRNGIRASEAVLMLTLGEGLEIEGKVVDEQGRGVDRCGVMAVPYDLAVGSTVYRDQWPACWTGEDGSFRLEGLPEGTQRLARWFGDGGKYDDKEPKRLEGGEAIGSGKTDVVLKLVPK